MRNMHSLAVIFSVLLSSAASAGTWEPVAARGFDAYLLSTPDGRVRMVCDPDTERAGQFLQIELKGQIEKGSYTLQISDKSFQVLVTSEIIAAAWTVPSLDLSKLSKAYDEAEALVITAPSGAVSTFDLGADRPAWCL